MFGTSETVRKQVIVRHSRRVFVPYRSRRGQSRAMRVKTGIESPFQALLYLGSTGSIVISTIGHEGDNGVDVARVPWEARVSIVPKGVRESAYHGQRISWRVDRAGPCSSN